MPRNLPAQSSLVQLKHQAKDLFRDFRAGAPDALRRFAGAHHRAPERAAATLSDAQLVIAHEYGFASWPKLKHHVEDLSAVEERVARVRFEFSSGTRDTRMRLLQAAHARERFENYDSDAPSLSDADARLMIANQEGYAYWNKYESYLNLDGTVKKVVAAVRSGNLGAAQDILRSDSEAANPRWVSGFTVPVPIPNDSIPMFCVSEGVFRGTNRKGNEHELTRALIEAGAQVDIEGGLPLASAVSFNASHVVKALLAGGAKVDGVDSDGVPMAYAVHFGFSEIAVMLAEYGAKLDLRFAAGLGGWMWSRTGSMLMAR
jgi:hypothetical protein